MPSSRTEFYLKELTTTSEEHLTGGEKAVASVLGSLYEGLENEKWVEGGANSPQAAAARKNVVLDDKCTCWRCDPKEKIVLLVRKDSKEWVSDDDGKQG